MKTTIWQDSYGKSRVRVTKVRRESGVHEVVELSVDIELRGDFAAAYSAGDNRLVIPTDTMKNTVYALARQDDVRAIEPFAWKLARHFVESFSHVEVATVEIVEQPWQRAEVQGQLHPHVFLGNSTERNTCSSTVVRDSGESMEVEISSGLTGLALMKTADSGFAKFLRDKYTTLADTDDRIFATTVDVEWSYNDSPEDYRALQKRIRETLIGGFAAKFSPSVQATMYEMATAVLLTESLVDSIRLTMPNQHRFLVNLAPFGLDNPNEIFVPIDEPFGKISAEFTRESSDEETVP